MTQLVTLTSTTMPDLVRATGSSAETRVLTTKTGRQFGWADIDRLAKQFKVAGVATSSAWTLEIAPRSSRT